MKLVYWTSFRDLGQHQWAEDATQLVFLRLAHQACAFREDISVPGWLFKTARMVSRDILKAEIRRRRREEKASREQMKIMSEPGWPEIEPWLNSGLSSLAEADRSVVLLRFFGGLGYQEIGQQYGISSEAARLRITRAVGRLRDYFQRHGVSLAETHLVLMLDHHAVPEMASPVAMPIPKLKGVSFLHIGAIAVQTKTLVGSIAVGILVLVLGVGLIAFRSGGPQAVPRHSPVKVDVSKPEVVATASTDSLKQVALLVILYASSHGNRFDFSNKDWQQKLAHSNSESDLFYYPDSSTKRFSFNDNLTGKSCALDAQAAAATVVAYEGADRKLDYRHDGKCAVAFVDGHVEMLGPDRENQLLW